MMMMVCVPVSAKRKRKSLSHVWLFATPWTIQSMGFSRLEYWSEVAFAFSRGSSQPRDQTQVSHIAGGCFTSWATCVYKCLCFPSFLGCLDCSVGKRNPKRKSLRETRNVALLFFSTRIVWTSQVVLVVNNPPASAGDIRDTSLIPDLGRSPGEGHGSPLQYSCLENPMDRGARWATVHGVTRVGHDWSDFTHMHYNYL